MAIARLELQQAEKIAVSDFNKKKRRMRSFKFGMTIDIDDNESKIDQLEEQAAPHELSSSDLSEQGKTILRGNLDLEKQISEKILEIEESFRGKYELESDLTEEQYLQRRKRIKAFLIKREKERIN